MNLELIKTAVTSRTARQILLLQKHSPKILFTAGVVGVVGTVVLACRATLQVSDVLDHHEKVQADLQVIDQGVGDNELSKLKLRTALEIAKLYAPSVGLGVLSIGALTGSHVVLSKRNTGTMAAYAAVDKAYRSYRERVVEAHGVDADRQFAQGATDREVEEKLSDGTTKTTVEKVVKGPQIGGSGYAQVFDERSGKFTTEPGMNANIVMMCQLYANDALRTRGHLFLNEVWDMLDLPRTKEGAVVGWVYEGGRDHTGDGYVDFQIFNGDNETVEAFIAGQEKYVVIDPNVDGPIWDKI